MQTHFENRLFDMVSDLFPEITVRRFSRMLGKSDGYWNSIKAQELALSTSALVNLRDALETRKILLANHGIKAERVEQIQVLIQDELINRFEAATEITLAGELDESVDEQYDVLPMIYQCS